MMSWFRNLLKGVLSELSKSLSRLSKASKYLLSAIVLLSSVVLFSCVAPTPTIIQAPPTPAPRPPRVDHDREEIIAEYVRKQKDRETCSDDDDCEDICKDIYVSRKNREDCEDLSIDQVKRLEFVHEALEDADYDDLAEVSSEELDVYVNIDISPLESISKKWKKSDAEVILEWIASSPEIAKVFEKEDDDYGVLSEILEALGSSGNSVPAKLGLGLQQDLEEGSTVFEVAIDEENVELLEWLHDFIEDKSVTVKSYNCAADQIETKDCIKLYCALSKSLDDDIGEELLDFDYFENYIDNIIDNKVNRIGWKDNDGGKNIEDIGDLQGAWWNNLCSKA